MTGVAVICFALLTGIFLRTMFVHYQAIDYPFLWHELPKIGLIAVATGLLSIPINRRGWLLHATFGIVVGFVLAVIAVKLQIAELMS